MAEAPGVTWHDIQEWGVEGQGWSDTRCPYDRLPARAEKIVPQAVWDLSRSATGMCTCFETDAPAIHARWQLRSAQLGEANFPVAGFSGLDLYGDDAGTWRWVAAGHQVTSQQPQFCLADGLATARRRYLLYLPLRNPVDKVEIGIPSGCRFEAVAPRRDKPLVFYGTSIVHGAYASHAGLVYTSILGRRLQQPVINLGFSGSARMEIEIAQLFAELDARAFVVDALPNMDTNLVTERAEAFVLKLRELRPAMPIVLVEDFPRTNAWIKSGVRLPVEEKCRRFHELHERLVNAGVEKLYYARGRELLGTDNEASIDGIHPSDLGYMRMADVLEPTLRAAMG